MPFNIETFILTNKRSIKPSRSPEQQWRITLTKITLNNDKKKILSKVSTIIIDNTGMVFPAVFAHISSVIALYR